MIGCARLAPELSAPAEHVQSGGNHARISGTSTPLVPAPSSADTAPPRVFETPREREDEMDVDLYGNDVTDAVAKYKLDSYGSLYELHSPETQLPRLGSPKG